MDQDLSQLVERVEQLEAELQAERERRQDLEQRVDEQAERIEELEQRVEQREELVQDRTPDDAEGTNLNDVWIADNPAGKLLEKVVQRSQENAERIEEAGEQGEPDAVDEMDEAAPPIYTLLRTPETNLKPTERRTRFLWADLGDYASRTPKGYVLNASDARRVLEAAEPEESDATRITSNHVGRVFDLSRELTREAVEIRKKDGERQLVVPTDWQEQARAAAPDSGVS